MVVTLICKSSSPFCAVFHSQNDACKKLQKVIKDFIPVQTGSKGYCQCKPLVGAQTHTYISVQPLCAEELAQNDRLRTMRGEADGDSAADLEDALVHQYDDSYAEMDAVGDDEPAESFGDLDPN